MNLIGLGANFVGFLLLFFFAMPALVQTGGGELVVITTDDKILKKERFYSLMSKFGFAAVIIGTGAQGVALLMSEGLIFAQGT
ncbi:MAG: hypothetical protein EOO15_22435 [Chitinophagaceae bacterium]|nr:MAG: hypothetical protein EOO15_22435 [Chitinophagaceae bacterium]